jgi:hypothetical protein
MVENEGENMGAKLWSKNMDKIMQQNYVAKLCSKKME